MREIEIQILVNQGVILSALAILVPALQENLLEQAEQTRKLLVEEYNQQTS